MRRIAPALGLFFLAPLVAEFLLGDFPVTYLAALVLLAPMYGGGAIVIREVARRTGRGWPTMALLALAYGVFEEGITTQSLFDPNYADAHLLDRGFIPALGIAVPWTLFVLTLHTVWSISAPIAMMEEMSARRTTPWLRTPGLVVASVLFVVGSIATTASSIASDHFVAPAKTLAIVAAIVVALIVVAFRLPRTRESLPAAATGRRSAPSAWVVFGGTVAAGLVFMLGMHLPTWLAVVAMLIAQLGATAAILAWSARNGWGARHRLALAAGALATYAWNSFTMHPVVDSTPGLTLVSHLVFALGAVVLVTFAVRRVAARPVPIAARIVEPVESALV